MSPNPRVLIVDDEAPLAGAIAEYLRREGFEVTVTHDGLSAVAMARRDVPDLIVLDLMLPVIDGIEVCRQVRQFSSAYVIMLTARDGELDKVLGLSMGADDYLVKPFSPRELVARVRAMLRRPRLPQSFGATPIRIHGGLRVDQDGRTLTVDGITVDVTRTEFDLLSALLDRPRAVLTRQQLLDAAWGPGWVGDEHVIDVHIAHLRTKLGDDAASARFIRTVRGVGYGLGPG
jgi:DNA-binding response OmpR family regulator